MIVSEGLRWTETEFVHVCCSGNYSTPILFQLCLQAVMMVHAKKAGCVVASAAVVFGTAGCHVRDYIRENTSMLVIYWFMYLTQLISG